LIAQQRKSPCLSVIRSPPTSISGLNATSSGLAEPDLSASLTRSRLLVLALWLAVLRRRTVLSTLLLLLLLLIRCLLLRGLSTVVLR
jgi:hypothetical protein